MTFENDLLREKEERFKEFVKLAASGYNLSRIPNIVFHDEYLSDGAIAHIHLDSWTICISRIHLKEMPVEQIKETAFHEVTHLLNASHNTFFYNKIDDSMTASWKPENSSGLSITNGNRKINKKIKKTKPKINKTRCIKCGETLDLKRCPYCRQYFCKEHFKPITPSMPNFNNPNKFDEWKRHGDDCHPCPSYYDYLAKKEKNQTRLIHESLDRMSGISRPTIKRHEKKQINEIDGLEKWIDKDKKQHKIKEKSRSQKIKDVIEQSEKAIQISKEVDELKEDKEDNAPIEKEEIKEVPNQQPKKLSFWKRMLKK